VDQIKKALEEQLDGLRAMQQMCMFRQELDLNVVSKIVEVSRLLLDLEKTTAWINKELTK
jgi:hypothetical protein